MAWIARFIIQFIDKEKKTGVKAFVDSITFKTDEEHKEDFQRFAFDVYKEIETAFNRFKEQEEKEP